MKIVKVIFSPEAEEVYKDLNAKAAESKVDGMILNALNKKIELIKTNIHYGEPIAKDLIPKEYKTRYGVTNLFRVELPQFWRMVYTLTDGESEIEIIAFVIDVYDHKKYNKKFGYKGK
jgi:hypothetical protein